MTRIYITVAVLAAIAGAWGYSLRASYLNGYHDATAAQEAADADKFREVIEEYNNATDSPISDDAADCLLRRISGIGDGEDCGAL